MVDVPLSLYVAGYVVGGSAHFAGYCFGNCDSLSAYVPSNNSHLSCPDSKMGPKVIENCTRRVILQYYRIKDVT